MPFGCGFAATPLRLNPISVYRFRPGFGCLLRKVFDGPPCGRCLSIRLNARARTCWLGYFYVSPMRVALIWRMPGAMTWRGTRRWRRLCLERSWDPYSLKTEIRFKRTGPAWRSRNPFDRLRTVQQRRMAAKGHKRHKRAFDFDCASNLSCPKDHARPAGRKQLRRKA